MKTFVILSTFFCGALCYPWGLPQPVQDTPEVAAAKLEHSAAHANAHYSSGSWGGQDRSWDDSHDDGSWKDDTKDVTWKHDDSWKQYDHSSGKEQVDDSWKATQSAWNHQSAVSHYDNHEKKWTGPVALPPGYDKHGAPLQVLDTPEVSAEKSKHFHLYAHAASHAAPHHDSHEWTPVNQHEGYHNAESQY